MRNKYEFIRYSSDASKELMEDLFKIARRQGVSEVENTGRLIKVMKIVCFGTQAVMKPLFVIFLYCGFCGSMKKMLR